MERVKTLVDYTLVGGVQFCDSLEKIVKEAICYGWEPQGSPFVRPNGEIWQAMIKKEKLV